MNKKRFTFLSESIIATIILVTLIINSIKSCPLVCTCKWKGGKRKVECANRNLTSLIADIDPETQVLDFSKNNLHILSEKMFDKANLTNLQKLYLSECQITRIQEIAFYGLSNLIELDLSNNFLTLVPSKIFDHLPLLMKLTLSGNPLRILQSKTFSSLKYLATLDLSNCQLDTIDKEVFQGIQKLEWLKLESNKLRTLKHPQTLPEVTGGLSLHKNPWKCDCHLRTFHKWLLNLNNIRIIVTDPVCEEPDRHRGTLITRLRLDDLACAPCVIPSSLFVEINEGKNISFLCQVNAVPEAEITWEFEGNPVSKNSSFIYPFYKYYAEEATTEQVSELFVYNAKKENNGTYRCTAQNVAGKSTSNYTLNVISMQKEIPQVINVSYFHIMVSSVSTILTVTLVTICFISCLVYFRKNKSFEKETKCQAEYKIIKQNVTETSSSTTDKRNPDLIVNAKNNLKDLHGCEHLLLLPNGKQRTYFTISDNINCENDGSCTEGHDSQLNCALANNEEVFNMVPTTSCSMDAGTIKVYLSSNSTQKLQSVYVNPFDSYIDSMEHWTFQLSENDTDNQTEKQQQQQLVFIDCCNNQIVNRELVCIVPVSNTTAITTTNNTNIIKTDFANLRHNLEGYPYPSKLKRTTNSLPSDIATVSCRSDNNELANSSTPILSPPDPFKTRVSFINVDAELSNELCEL